MREVKEYAETVRFLNLPQITQDEWSDIVASVTNENYFDAIELPICPVCGAETIDDARFCYCLPADDPFGGETPFYDGRIVKTFLESIMNYE